MTDSIRGPRPFVLVRHEDISGVSGQGVVAQGCVFADGTVALRWLSAWPTSVVFHDRGIEAVEAVHGHGGATEIVFTEGDPAPLDLQAIKVAVCEYLLSLNEGNEIPFVPPTAIDWMGNGLTDAVRKVAS